MMRSMFSGVSGLRVHQTKMDVIANNIANVNTIGFKSSRVTFRDAFYQRLQGAAGANPATGRAGSNPQQIGLGVSLGSIDTVMTQGMAMRTDRSLDVMIEGDGFFIVKDQTGTYFTRAGNIDIDAQMNLHINGMKLMGWDRRFVDGEYVIETGPVKELNLGGDKQFMEPEATTIVDLIANLTPQGLIGNTVQSQMSITDSLGNPFTIDVTFTYHPQGTPDHDDQIHGIWTYEFSNIAYPNNNRKDGKEIAIHTGTPLSAYTSGIDPVMDYNALPFDRTGVLVFDTNGMLVLAQSLSDAVPNATNLVPGETIIFDQALLSDLIADTINNPANGVPPQIPIYIAPIVGLNPPSTFGTPTEWSVDYVDTDYQDYEKVKPIGLINLDVSRLTQFQSDIVSTKFMQRDGNGPGELRDISVGAGGVVTGRYSNGKTRVLCQIPIALFQNPAGLEKMGSNLFAVTTNSGGFNGIGDAGDMRGGALEMSNVDLSQEFTEMITTQRGFQASSRIITVSDEMLVELVNLKR